MRFLSQLELKEVENAPEPDRTHFLSMRAYPPFPDFPIEYTLEAPPDSLVFDSRFESGNLAKVVKVGERDYDLYLSFDTETKGHTQWYYFAVTNALIGTFRFNVVNLLKFDSLYNEGLLPAVRSMRQGGDWQRGGFNVSYYQNGRRQGTERHSYTLTFQYTFQIPHDTVYFAHCFPYTFTDLCKYLDHIKESYSDIARVSPMCKTLAGNVCEMLTITHNVDTYRSHEEEVQEWSMSAAARKLNQQRLQRQEKLAENIGKKVQNEHKRKQGIVLTARTHPGETPGSYMMKGVIDFLLSDIREAKLLRRNYVFKIVPMVNPDGVRYGNYRCSALGVDLNRRWDVPSRPLHPTVYHVKRMVQAFAGWHNVVLFCDFHGHSCKRGVFAYGCARKTCELEDRKKSILARMVPLLLSQRNACFSFKDCHFRMDKSKESTARVVGFKELSIVNSYTIEASFYGPKSGTDFVPARADCHMLRSDYEEIGKDLCKVCLYFASKSIFARKLRAVSDWFRAKNDAIPIKSANFLRSKSMQDSLIQKTQIPTPFLEHIAEFPVQDTSPMSSVAASAVPSFPSVAMEEDLLTDLESVQEGNEEEEVLTGALQEDKIWEEWLENEEALESNGEDGESDSAPSDPEEAITSIHTPKPRKKPRRKTRSTKPHRTVPSEDLDDNKPPQRVSHQGLRPVPPLPRPMRPSKSPTGYPNSSIVTFSFLEDSTRVSTSETSREAGLRRPGRLAELLRGPELRDGFPLQVNGMAQGRKIGISNYSYLALQKQLERQEDKGSRIASAQPCKRTHIQLKPQPPQDDSLRRFPKSRPVFRRREAETSAGCQRKQSDAGLERVTPKEGEGLKPAKGKPRPVFL